MLSGKKLSYAAAAILAAAAMGTSARADTLFTLGTNGNNSGTADFSISGNTLTLVLTNTDTQTGTGNNNQGNSISGLQFATSFTINSILTGVGNTVDFDTSTTASNVNLLQTDPDDVNPTAPEWEATFLTPNHITSLGNGSPDYMIIGAGGAPDGNTKNFEPYVQTTATFTFNISDPGLTPTIGPVTFEFGTGPDTVTVVPPGGCTGDNCNTGGGVPEPASLSLLGLGGLGLMIRRRNRR